jgi:hypothetical protein
MIGLIIIMIKVNRGGITKKGPVAVAEGTEKAFLKAGTNLKSVIRKTFRC